MALNTALTLNLVATSTKAAVIGNVPTDPLNLTRVVQYGNGTGAGNADQLYYAERTLAPSATETLDISGGLTDNLGQTFTIARVKMLMVIAEPSNPLTVRNTNDVVVGAAGATQWAALLGTTGTLTLKPGSGCVFFANVADAVAWVAANGATDSLKVANSAAGTSVTYQIFIIGVSA